MDGLSIIALAIISIIELSPFILGWIGYSYIFSKLIYSFAKRYLNINISFSKTWAITFLSGMTSFIITLIFISLYFSYSIALTTLTLEIFTATIVPVFITSLIAYKYLSNAGLGVAIVMSFASLLTWLTFTIIVYITVNYVLNVLLNPCYDRICY
ncbi:hypothetical protein Nps_00890 [Candidatus Nanopusillus acidilobi]|nr:hypothetical protein Nps_00890 [Candidatus Nanopusillus acidilobi]